MIDTTIATASLAAGRLQEARSSLGSNEKKLKDQTDGFEAILIKQMLDEAMDSKHSLFPKQPGEDIYRSMFTDALSKDLSGNFGFSKLLFDYLKQNPTVGKDN